MKQSCLKFRIINIQTCTIPSQKASSFDACESEFSQGTLLKSIPLIKIYAHQSSQQNEKSSLLLIHGVFPYFYALIIEIEGRSKGKFFSSEARKERILLNEAGEVALKLGALLERVLGTGSVHKIGPVRGKSMYGFWEEEESKGENSGEFFLKISLCNPVLISKAAALVSSGQWGGKAVIFEAHIPWRLQVMMDLGLYGMDWIELEHWEQNEFGMKSDNIRNESLAVASSSSSSYIYHSWPQFIRNRKRLVQRSTQELAVGKFRIQPLETFLANTHKLIMQPEKEEEETSSSAISTNNNTSPFTCKTQKQAANDENSSIPQIPTAFESVECFWAPLPKELSFMKATEMKKKEREFCFFTQQQINQQSEFVDGDKLLKMLEESSCEEQLVQMIHEIFEEQEESFCQIEGENGEIIPEYESFEDQKGREQSENSKIEHKESKDANLFHDDYDDQCNESKNFIHSKQSNEPKDSYSSNQSNYSNQTTYSNNLQSPSSEDENLAKIITRIFGDENEELSSPDCYKLTQQLDGIFDEEENSFSSPQSSPTFCSPPLFSPLSTKRTKSFFKSPKQQPPLASELFNASKHNSPTPNDQHQIQANQDNCHLQIQSLQDNCHLQIQTPNRLMNQVLLESKIQNLQPLVELPSSSTTDGPPLRIMSMELFCLQGQDPILCICWCCWSNSKSKKKGKASSSCMNFGCIKIFDAISWSLNLFPKWATITSSSTIQQVPDEPSLIAEFVKVLQDFDPDILVGFRLDQVNSWNYLSQRIFQCKYPGISQYCLSRDNYSSKEVCNSSSLSNYHCGRLLMDVQRILTHEYSLNEYSFQACMWAILGEKLPKYSQRKKCEFWTQETTKLPSQQHRLIKSMLHQVRGNLSLLLETGILARGVEFARLYGIDLDEVFARGSQFKVEGVMLRIAKVESFLPYSPTALQVANMKATEFLPLVMDPVPCVHTNPIIVLDFASLYPSLVIAYNLCYTTCLGSGKTEEFGAGYPLRPHLIREDCDELASTGNGPFLAPNGVYFVGKDRRQSLLAKMLNEILTARTMVKQLDCFNSEMEAIQLGLKLLANTTYGYCGASRTGRMPMIEVADAIVSLGRRTLEAAIQAIESHPTWNARVVYGDTDSLFVAVNVSLSIPDLYALAREMAQLITSLNPEPVKVKVEKVYKKAILIAKKRYIGWKICPTTGTCTYDAKGVESVRRDYCPLAGKVLEKFCCVLFESGREAALDYFKLVCNRLLTGYYPTCDLILTKPWRPGHQPPSSAIESEGRWGDRRNYLAVINEATGKGALIEGEKFSFSSYSLDYVYYATKQLIPVLQRCVSSLEGCAQELEEIWKREYRGFAPVEWSLKLCKIDAYLGRKASSSCFEAEEVNWWKKVYAEKHQQQREWKLKQACSECMECSIREADPEQECIQVECPLYWRLRNLKSQECRI